MAALGSMVRLVAVLWGAGLGAPPANPPAKLLDVRAVSDASGVLVKITLSEPRSPRRMAINDPPRLVFDFPDTLLPGGSQQIDVQHKLLRAVRIGQASAEPPIARVVLDLPDRSDAVARKGDDGRTWTVALGQVGEVGRSAAAATEPPPPPPRLSAAGWAQQNGDDAVLVLKADRVPEPQTSYREDPERLVVDFAGIVGEVSKARP